MQTILITTLIVMLMFEVFMICVLLRIFKKVEATNKLAVDSLISQNSELSGQLQQLHLEILSLNHELTLLAIENKKLNHEVSSLSDEVERLQHYIKQEQSDD